MSRWYSSTFRYIWRLDAMMNIMAHSRHRRLMIRFTGWWWRLLCLWWRNYGLVVFPLKAGGTADMKIFLHKPGVIDVLIKRAKIIYQHRNQSIISIHITGEQRLWTKMQEKTMFHCFHRFWTITAPQKNISAVTDTPMRIRPYLPKKATDTNERTAIQSRL